MQLAYSIHLQNDRYCVGCGIKLYSLTLAHWILKVLNAVTICGVKNNY